jgi:hypothetical protein
MTNKPSFTDPPLGDLMPEVIDLTDGSSGKVTVRLPHYANPLESMTAAEHRRLLIRVLCELVAYDEPVEPVASPDDTGPGIRIPAYTNTSRPPPVQAPPQAVPVGMTAF